jgi:hypothetical protein
MESRCAIGLREEGAPGPVPNADRRASIREVKKKERQIKKPPLESLSIRSTRRCAFVATLWQCKATAPDGEGLLSRPPGEAVLLTCAPPGRRGYSSSSSWLSSFPTKPSALQGMSTCAALLLRKLAGGSAGDEATSPSACPCLHGCLLSRRTGRRCE